ncbi:hypothetical protein C0992_011944 [Termitomyces sp. T32_za158]|nr:hypothetical protein C0992_011944 [Termitomyces sp. T32_za158]
MAKVGADIHATQKETGFVEEQAKRKNHDDSRVSELLAVPWYADLLDSDTEKSDGEAGTRMMKSRLVKSRDGRREEMAKWVEAEQDRSDDEEVADAVYGRQRSKWLPHSLDLLFGGQKEMDIDQHVKQICRQQAYTEEAQLMELLADEEADNERIPDDGELEGLGDDFEE